MLSILVTLAATCVPPPDELKAVATDGELRGLAFEASLELDLDSLRYESKGRPVPFDTTGATLHVEEKRSVRLVDSHRRVSDGKAATITREFVHAAGSSAFRRGEGERILEYERERESPLRGAKAEFTWSDRNDRYEAELPDLEDGEEYADELDAELDLAGLLPGRAVEPGDEWHLGRSAWIPLLRPGGDLAWSREPGERSAQRFGSLLDELEGVLKATYRGRERLGQREVAIFALEGELDTQLDEQDTGRESGASIVIRASAKLEGSVTWDIARGRFTSVDLGGELRAEYELHPQERPGSEWHPVDSFTILTGRLDVRATCRDAAPDEK